VEDTEVGGLIDDAELRLGLVAPEYALAHTLAIRFVRVKRGNPGTDGTFPLSSGGAWVWTFLFENEKSRVSLHLSAIQRLTGIGPSFALLTLG
jgi:hypothetical protein